MSSAIRSPTSLLDGLARASGTNPRDVRGWVDCLGALVWPSRCLVCKEAGVAGHDLCHACHAALPWNRSACAHCAIPLPAVPSCDIADSANAADSANTSLSQTCGDCLSTPPPIELTHATFIYRAPIDKLLPRFKFHQDLAAGRLLAQLMLSSVPSGPMPDALIPIPLHRARLRQRGYDQALELARPLSRALAIPLRDDLLIRTRHTAQQSSLDAEQRHRNVRGAFSLRPQSRRPAALPAHVALIDDVMTTGATLHAAALALRKTGIARVDAWICARVP